MKEIEISKKEFINDYHNLNSKQVCDKWDISRDDIYKLLIKFGHNKRKNEKRKFIFTD